MPELSGQLASLLLLSIRAGHRKLFGLHSSLLHRLSWLLGFCIRNTLPLFDSNIESSLVEFKKRASCISTEVLNISRSSLSRVKQWISTIIHDLEMLECNIENHFQDVFGDLES